MKTLQVCIIYIEADAAFAKQLATDIKKTYPGVDIVLPEISLIPGEAALKINADVVLVVLSPAALKYTVIEDEVLFALQTHKNIIPVLYKTIPSTSLYDPFLPISFLKDYTEAFKQLSYSLQHILNRFNNDILVSAPMQALPQRNVSPSRSKPPKKKNIIKSIINSLNLFKKKVLYEELTGGAAPEAATSVSMIEPSQPDRSASRSSANAAASVPPPSPAPQASNTSTAKGKLLYDIPDNMRLNQQHKCIVRIGENELIVRDDDTFSGSEKTEDIPISRVMNAELIDISDPPHFTIKTITSAEQEIEEGNYTQWLFWVTPLVKGNSSLLVKVSVIKIIDGKERRKELVFEKPVNIEATAVADVQNFTGKPTKNLLEEEDVKEYDPPSVFISYAHKDKNYFNVFLDNLSAESGWHIWTDKNIEIGTDWYERIQQSIKQSDMAVLLVSAYFISSGFIKENEYEKFIDLKNSKRGFLFLPVLLRDTDIERWKSLSKLQFFAADGDEYGYAAFKNKLMPFAALCIYNEKGELNENFHRDTYFKKFVSKANTDWLITKKLRSA